MSQEMSSLEKGLLLFGIGSQLYAVSTDLVREVILIPPSFRKLTEGPWDGEMVYRKRKLPLLDLLSLSGESWEGKEAYGLVFSFPWAEWGFIVSGVQEILLYQPTRLPLPEALEWVEEAFARDDEMILKMNPERLMLYLTSPKR